MDHHYYYPTIDDYRVERISGIPQKRSFAVPMMKKAICRSWTPTLEMRNPQKLGDVHLGVVYFRFTRRAFTLFKKVPSFTVYSYLEAAVEPAALLVPSFPASSVVCCSCTLKCFEWTNYGLIYGRCTLKFLNMVDVLQKYLP